MEGTWNSSWRVLAFASGPHLRKRIYVTIISPPLCCFGTTTWGNFPASEACVRKRPFPPGFPRHWALWKMGDLVTPRAAVDVGGRITCALTCFLCEGWLCAKWRNYNFYLAWLIQDVNLAIMQKNSRETAVHICFWNESPCYSYHARSHPHCSQRLQHITPRAKAQHHEWWIFNITAWMDVLLQIPNSSTLGTIVSQRITWSLVGTQINPSVKTQSIQPVWSISSKPLHVQKWTLCYCILVQVLPREKYLLHSVHLWWFWWFWWIIWL